MNIGNVVFCVLTGSKEARIFWEVREDSQSSDQQQHVVRRFTGKSLHGKQQTCQALMKLDFNLNSVSVAFFPRGPAPVPMSHISVLKTLSELSSVSTMWW